MKEPECTCAKVEFTAHAWPGTAGSESAVPTWANFPGVLSERFAQRETEVIPLLGAHWEDKWAPSLTQKYRHEPCSLVP